MSTEKSASAVFEKTAEEKAADAFEYGMGKTLKKAGITDPEEVQYFMQAAGQVAAMEQEAANGDA